jgi:hypothetical protein
LASNDYAFLTHWRVPGTLEQAYDILIDVRGYLRWWPDVYLEVGPIGSISAGVGAKTRLLTRGKLPYKLHWQAEIIEADRPISFVIRATGDFDGHDVWSLQPQDNDVAIAFDWRLRAEKPLLRYLSFLFKPLFKWNHRWAMVCGEEGLRAEIARRR